MIFSMCIREKDRETDRQRQREGRGKEGGKERQRPLEIIVFMSRAGRGQPPASALTFTFYLGQRGSLVFSLPTQTSWPTDLGAS